MAIARPETIVHRVVSTMPGEDTNYTIGTHILPPGLYYLALATKSTITDGATTTIAVSPFVSEDQSQLSDISFQLLESNDTAFITSIAMGNSTKGHYVTIHSVISTLPQGHTPTLLNGGIRIDVVKGNAGEDDVFEVDLIATRIA